MVSPPQRLLVLYTSLSPIARGKFYPEHKGVGWSIPLNVQIVFQDFLQKVQLKEEKDKAAFSLRLEFEKPELTPKNCYFGRL